jgi:Tfp pilus assembly protein PilF
MVCIIYNHIKYRIDSNTAVYNCIRFASPSFVEFSPLAGKARELLEKSLDLDPTNAHSWTQLTRLLTSDPLLHDCAEGTFLRALTACPGNTHILHVLSTHLLATGHTERALQVLHSLAHKEPDNGIVLHSLGLLKLQDGNRLEAAVLFKRGMKSPTMQARLLCVEELARLSVLEGRPEVGRQLYKHASGWGTQLSSRFLREWGMFERRMGNAEQARSLLRQSVELRAMDVQSWIAWALLERSEHNLDEALYLLQQVRTCVCHDNRHYECQACTTFCRPQKGDVACNCESRDTAAICMLTRKHV